ncbi:MAG: paraquat-inducible protein [Paraburkholderia sp.]|jgi:paraquat-inducible protein A|nr:paraquat-inducible protein [Paraburkholderia sp.]
MDRLNLIACRECDALLRKPPHAEQASARCPRCGATLSRSSAAHVEHIAALTLAALITFTIAQVFPIVELDLNGVTSQTTLIGALLALWNEQMEVVAALVFCSTILFPLVELVALLYLLMPIRAGIVPPGFDTVLRAIQFVRPWSMIEVLMLGILVTIVKMSSLARAIPEAALFAFGGLTLMLAVVVMFDPCALWDIADALPARRAKAALSPHSAQATQAAPTGSDHR